MQNKPYTSSTTQKVVMSRSQILSLFIKVHSSFIDDLVEKVRESCFIQTKSSGHKSDIFQDCREYIMKDAILKREKTGENIRHAEIVDLIDDVTNYVTNLVSNIGYSD